MLRGDIGFMATPRQGNRLRPEYTWGADNGCFSHPELFNLEKYLGWLDGLRDKRSKCLFATAPDVMGDAAATIELSLPVLSLIREIGYPAALVAQDGLDREEVPWSAFDVLFIGGSTEFKLGPAARDLTAQALERDKRVHMGRVNSRKRFRYAVAIGCESCDGTFLTFGPKVNLPRLMAWIQEEALAA